MRKIKRKTPQQIKEHMRKKCVTLAKKIARTLAGFRCEYCGEGEPTGKQTHGSHIYGEGTYKSMSADVDNILCLCATHHIGGFWRNSKEPSWHESPMEMVKWFVNKYPERDRILEKRSQNLVQCDLIFWERKYKELKEQYNNVVDGT